MKNLVLKTLNLIVLFALLFQIFVPSFVSYAGIIEGSIANFGRKTTQHVNSSHTRKPLKKVVKGTSTRKEALKLSKVSGGPGQKESSGFSLTSTDDLVDKFTGDFQYSIPLADVEGYPIVLSYNSTIGMNSEASWVGLGWDLNVGAVSREMRGLPDEFNGEQTIDRTYNQGADISNGKKFGGFAGVQLPLGDSPFSLGLQATALRGSYNSSYLGYGKTFDFNIGASASLTYSEGAYIKPSFGLGYSSDTKRGIGKNTSYGISIGNNEQGTEKSNSGGITLTKSYHTRAGLMSKSIGFDASATDISGNGFDFGVTTTIPYGTMTSVPNVRLRNFTNSTSNGQRLYFKSPSYSTVGITAGIMFKQDNSNSHVVIIDNQIKQNAIGYFHSGKTDKYFGTQFLMDFNRFEDKEFSQNMKNLPVSIQTYDVFRANAMGLGASFRGHRSDIGTYKDPYNFNQNITDGLNLGLGYQPITFPTEFSLYIEGSGVSGNGEITSGEITNGVQVDFTVQDKSTSFDNSIYFKGVGEGTPEDMSDLTTLGGHNPGYFKLTNDGTFAMTNVFKTNTGQAAIDMSALYQNPTLVRSYSYKPYTAEEYNSINSSIQNGSSTFTRIQTSSPNSPYYKNHLSAVEIVNTSGVKYIFDVPAYDLKSEQVSFSYADSPINPNNNPNNGCVEYYVENLSNTNDFSDNSIQNDRGVSNFYDKTTVPAYPHSFLLSQMYGPDYIDRTNNGPTIDDIGNYYKFNHIRIYDQTTPYKWRFPYEANTAYFSNNLLGTSLDDMANYSYGEKEIWYTESVESKNIIAEFILEDRDDACAVTDENGGRSNNKLQRLAKIIVYNRAERTNPVTGDDAVPLQVIEFEYSYELCKNQPSNSNTGSIPAKSGKLTLNGIRSYSGNSEELGLYTYQFSYGEYNSPSGLTIVNKDYNLQADAWGNYKEVETGSLSSPSTPYEKPIDLFPYANQDESIANELAHNWKLTTITNPSKGQIKINYESDTYTTIQNKRASKHVDIYKMVSLIELKNLIDATTTTLDQNFPLTVSENQNVFSSNLSGSLSGSVNSDVLEYFENFGRVKQKILPHNVVLFKLDEGLSTTMYSPTQASAKVKDLYFLENEDPNTGSKTYLEELFFRLFVKVKGTLTNKELIETFGKVGPDFKRSTSEIISSIGVLPQSGGEFKFGYVILKPGVVKEEGILDPIVFNSLQENALDYVRRNLSDVVYGTAPSTEGDLTIDKALRRNGDVNLVMAELGWCPSFSLVESSIRLSVPKYKFGGNGRVKSIIYKDNWNELSSEYNSQYEWQYSYPFRNESAGNAAFEPLGILDECTLHKWDTYMNKIEQFPDEMQYNVLPLAVQLFPNPVIGYQEVRVEILQVQNKGRSISTFYTSYEKPTFEKRTSIAWTPVYESVDDIPGYSMEKRGAMQGHYLETNDFHGKPRESKVIALVPNTNGGFDEVVNARTKYIYAESNDNFKMLNDNGQLLDKTINEEYDIHLDSRYITNTYSNIDLGATVKLNISLILPPFVFPQSIVPTFSFSKRDEAFYTTATIKHVNKSAVVIGVETESLGSMNYAENLVYDYATGDVLVSSLKDEFNDKLYSINYPAHWYYRQFGSVYDTKIENIDFNSANIVQGGFIKSLVEGDYIQLTKTTSPSLGSTFTGWLAKNNASNNYYLMDANGQGISVPLGNYDVNVIKSNRENRLSETMESVVTKKNPIVGNIFNFPLDDVISSSAVSYKDRGTTNCSTFESEDFYNTGDVLNPYLLGIRGHLVPDAQYAWQSERKNVKELTAGLPGTFSTEHGHGIRFDGTYTTYSSYYRIGVLYNPPHGDNPATPIPGTERWYAINEIGHPNNVTTDANYQVGEPYQKWRNLGTVVKYDFFGKPLESKDQIGVYSSVLYGYNSKLRLVPVAQAVNARQQEIAFDGFEDYSYYEAQTPTTIPLTPHFKFSVIETLSGIGIDKTVRHSGNNSLRLPNTTSITTQAKIDNGACGGDSFTDVPGTNQFSITDCGCVDPFKPTPGQYIVSAWAKVKDPNLSTVKIVITVTGGGTYTFIPSGPILDGWQRIEGSFDIATNATDISVKMENTSGTTVHFDDLRIHPYLAGMTTTVYDPKTLLPLATHDGYNFTTFYNYDENLNLTRVRVETTEGIKTVSESEMGGYKQPKP